MNYKHEFPYIIGKESVVTILTQTYLDIITSASIEISQECRSGRTALHYAVESRDPDLVAHIVTVCRASVTAQTYSRLSPYQVLN